MALMYLVLPEGEEFRAAEDLVNRDEPPVWPPCDVLPHAEEAAAVARSLARQVGKPYVVAKVVQVSYHPARGLTDGP